MMSVFEVAKWMRVSEMTVYRWIHRGWLPAAQPGGGDFRIKRSDVDALTYPKEK
jgi:excisionase family DNA binding protein